MFLLGRNGAKKLMNFFRQKTRGNDARHHRSHCRLQDTTALKSVFSRKSILLKTLNETLSQLVNF
jgi:hypothetical protein